MARPYEFADERLYTDEQLMTVAAGCHNMAIQTDDVPTLQALEHMGRHAVWEHKQRREDRLQAVAGRIVIENEQETA